MDDAQLVPIGLTLGLFFISILLLSRINRQDVVEENSVIPQEINQTITLTKKPKHTIRPVQQFVSSKGGRYSPFLNLPDCDVTGFNEAIIEVFGLDANADNINTTLNNYRKNIVAKGFVKRIGSSRFSRYIGVGQ